jgi:hypothetical protein
MICTYVAGRPVFSALKKAATTMCQAQSHCAQQQIAALVDVTMSAVREHMKALQAAQDAATADPGSIAGCSIARPKSERLPKQACIAGIAAFSHNTAAEGDSLGAAPSPMDFLLLAIQQCDHDCVLAPTLVERTAAIETASE